MEPQNEVNINLVADKILEGWSRKDVENYAMKELNVSKTTARRYMEEATKRVGKLFEERFESKLPSIAGSFQQIYERAMRDGDLKSANEAMKNLAMLLGHMKTKVESKTEITTSSELKETPTEELIRLAKGGS